MLERELAFTVEPLDIMAAHGLWNEMLMQTDEAL